MFDKVLCYEKELLNLKCSKLGQILCANKTGFRRLGHIFITLHHNIHTYNMYIPQILSDALAALHQQEQNNMIQDTTFQPNKIANQL